MYDLIIIGGGVAAFAAALYAGRFQLKTLLLAEELGGTIILTNDISNYPGFERISGMDLFEKIKQHAQNYDIEIIEKKVEKVKKNVNCFYISTKEKTYQTKTIIFATGTDWRKLDVPGEKEFANKGVHYCALCLPPDESIIVNGTIKKIKEITPLTKVLTINGAYKNIEGFTRRKYKGKLIKIKPRFFSEPVLLTPDHPVLITNIIKGIGSDYWKDFRIVDPKWKKAGKLIKGDCVLYPVIKEIKDINQIKISDYIEVEKVGNGAILPFISTHTSNKVKDRIPINKGFMRLVGYYISEGSSWRHSLSFYFKKDEGEYIKDTICLLKKIFKLKIGKEQRKSVYSIKIYSKIICDLFKNLFGSHAYDKSLPQWVMTLPIDKQKELIKGLWRGDGCLREKDFTYVTSSRKLTYQLRDLLLRQGIIPSIQIRDKRGLNRSQNKIEGRIIGFNYDKYHITVGGQFLEKMSSILEVEHPLLNERTHICNHAWLKDGFAILPIRDISTIDYNGEVLNMGVAENNTYVAKNFIVHNCDGSLYKNKIIGVVGGSDSAAKEALLLAEYGKKVYIIYRKEKIRAEPINAKKIQENKKIEIINNTNVKEIKGNKFVKSVIFDRPYKGSKELKLDALFINIGHIPVSDLSKRIGVKTNEKGEIIIDKDSKTNVEGVFACGDVVNSKFKQAITGVAEGVIATYNVYQYLTNELPVCGCSEDSN